jgi:ABC-type nitrate/sulfonate/bicarbonate transport system substrate-binding protein
MLKLAALIAAVLAVVSGGISSDAATTRPKVAISHGALNARIAPLWIAQEQNFFAKNGVDAEIVLVRQTQVTIGGISTGEIQIGYTSGSTLLGAAAGGLDLKMVAALNARVGYDLVAVPSIKSPRDLRGKRFGIQVFGAGLWMGAILGLEHLGLEPQRDNINILQVGDQRVLTQALETGRIDAAVLDGVFSRRLQQKGFMILAHLNQANIPYIGLGMVLKSAFIREHPEAVEGILKGLVETIAFILSPKNKPAVTKTIMKYLKISDPAEAEEGYQDLLTLERKPFPSVEGLRNMQRLMKIGNPKLGNVKVEELIDDRILRKLDESGFIDRLFSTYGVK